jgi:hypothetical protein
VIRWLLDLVSTLLALLFFGVVIRAVQLDPLRGLAALGATVFVLIVAFYASDTPDAKE